MNYKATTKYKDNKVHRIKSYWPFVTYCGRKIENGFRNKWVATEEPVNCNKCLKGDYDRD